MACVTVDFFLLILEKNCILEVSEVRKKCWFFFIPPHKHLVGGELLYLYFKRKETKNLANLNGEAGVFGIDFSGDSERVKRIPLNNTIALSENCSPSVLEIHYCLEHMVT